MIADKNHRMRVEWLRKVSEFQNRQLKMVSNFKPGESGVVDSYFRRMTNSDAGSQLL
jgi:hypothetical protein